MTTCQPTLKDFLRALGMQAVFLLTCIAGIAIVAGLKDLLGLTTPLPMLITYAYITLFICGIVFALERTAFSLLTSLFYVALINGALNNGDLRLIAPAIGSAMLFLAGVHCATLKGRPTASEVPPVLLK